ncbi:CAP domain-containing protein [Thermostaphylospora chromogena]|uniref:Cysteine-rich secretory protein family protein n=1 Tax=Thermostaphylospora chromogena TaxID=35622 RepID=A0A1H1E574_9ACTN|nr:CAP domain-containing protein [Thermostaphylospora chromogena]SDQ83911.1 Cysteine-rich secretory protein family protein [Thermostaphylospora chromogena]
MRLSPHPRHPQRSIQRRNHLGMSACLMIAVLLTGILIGRLSRGPDTSDQIFLNNAAPGTSTPTSDPPSPHAEESRAPLGTVVRSAPSPSAERVRPSAEVSKAPREKKSTADQAHRDDLGDATTALGSEHESRAGETDLAALEAEVVRLTNAARRRAGCRPLRVDARLVRSARQHSRDMAATGLLSHDSSDGTSPWLRMERAGYPDGGAENIGRGYQDAEEAVRGWMSSRRHRQNIVNCELRAIGVGVAEGEGGPWWTQDFGYS